MKGTLGGFVGERLRSLRAAKGLTAVELAERIGVTRGAISQFETGSTYPKPTTLAQIANEFQVPQSFFLWPIPQEKPSPSFFRSLASTTKRAREAAAVRVSWAHEIYSLLSDYVDFPVKDLPVVVDNRRPEELDDEEIEQLAYKLREKWGLGFGPIPNLVTLLEAKGFLVTRFSFGDVDLDGFSRDLEGLPVIALNADKNIAVRSRFDAAHELGHLVLHGGNVAAGNERKPELHKRLESQAHRFAAAFLFPARAFSREVYSLGLESLLEVKKRWLVSVQMMIFRAQTLGLASQSQCEYAFRTLSARGFRKREPLDDVLIPEEPQVLRRAIEMISDHAVLSKNELSTLLPLGLRDFEILCQLSCGFFTGKESEADRVVELKPRTSNITNYVVQAKNVVPFRKSEPKT